MITLFKHGSHDQKTHGHAGLVPHGSAGGDAVHRNLGMHLAPISAKVDGIKSNPTIAGDLAQAKVTLHAASIAPTAMASAQALGNTRLALSSAARKVTGTNTPLAITLADIGKEAQRLSDSLLRP
jgi:hypothetical protein